MIANTDVEMKSPEKKKTEEYIHMRTRSTKSVARSKEKQAGRLDAIDENDNQNGMWSFKRIYFVFCYKTYKKIQKV